MLTYILVSAGPEAVYEVRGLSSDTKPTTLANGTTFREIDTGNLYMFDKTNSRWMLIEEGGTGGGGASPFPSDFVTNKTTAEFGRSVVNSSSFTVGKTWLGELTCTDLPNGLINIECTVQALTSSIAVVRLSSSNREPYIWEYNTASYNDQYHWDWKLVPAIQSREIPETTGVYPVTATVNTNGGVKFGCTADDAAKAVLNIVYPVGSVYISVGNTCPFGFGTWVQLATGKTLWNIDPAGSVAPGSEIAQGLPNITASVAVRDTDKNDHSLPVIEAASGAFNITTDGGAHATLKYNGDTNYEHKVLNLNASASNPIYGATTNVQPAAVAVTMWKRTA